MLLPLRQNLIGDRHRHTGQALPEDRLDALFVHRREIGVQQHDGDGLDFAFGGQFVGESGDLRLVQRFDDITGRTDAFVDFESVAGA